MDEDEIIDNPVLDSSKKSKELRKQIIELVKIYVQETHPSKSFIPGKTIVPVSGKVFDSLEIEFLIASGLDFWLTSDRFNHQFEKKLSQFLNSKFVLTTNSGSSANLLAVSALTSERLGPRSLKPGDEVITVAACFPTTVNPLIQNDLIPVFVDIDLSTLSINVDSIESAISDKTKAIMVAHMLGNPFDIEQICEIAKKHNLWIIEDCCDALGSKFKQNSVGTFGDIGTLSFFPAHQITMGEGGAIFTNNPQLKKIIESLRDWGRDCYCSPGKNNTCGKRFDWKLGDLPQGYDHKYTYSETGYNLKITEMQAAIGLAQLEKLPSFIEKRQENFLYLKKGLSKFTNIFILPESLPFSDPAWFGFPITVRLDAPFTKDELIQFLSSHLIDTRPLFAGNITKQPYFKNKIYRISGNLKNTDIVMAQTFWIGTFPGLTKEMLQYILDVIEDFCMKEAKK
jgi:CDP-4-dehydro-6-deoxyglucose reductase, E1